MKLHTPSVPNKLQQWDFAQRLTSVGPFDCVDDIKEDLKCVDNNKKKAVETFLNCRKVNETD